MLGLATGSTPLGLYKELVRMHKDEGLDFSQVTTFNLDEYVGLPQSHDQSYHYFMHENLLKHINVAKQNIHIPSGTTDNYEAFCAWYEARIVERGGIDLQILGIGTDGHIAFNEPTSSLVLADAHQDSRPADHRRQRPIFFLDRQGADLRHYHGRGDDHGSQEHHPPGQRREEGPGGGRRGRRPRKLYMHRQQRCNCTRTPCSSSTMPRPSN